VKRIPEDLKEEFTEFEQIQEAQYMKSKVHERIQWILREKLNYGFFTFDLNFTSEILSEPLEIVLR
jgi:hypothetical protein